MMIRHVWPPAAALFSVLVLLPIGAATAAAQERTVRLTGWVLGG